MFTWLLSLALSAEIVLDAKVSTRLSVDGVAVAELFRPGLLHVEIPAGDHEVIVVADGHTSTFRASIRDDSPLIVFAGRTGITLGEAPSVAPTAVAPGPWTVRFRVGGRERLLVSVDNQRIVVSPGEGSVLTVTGGDHRLSVRSSDGTMVYARGMLRVNGGDNLTVQIGEGALPETSGSGLSFVADGL